MGVADLGVGVGVGVGGGVGIGHGVRRAVTVTIVIIIVAVFRVLFFFATHRLRRDLIGISVNDNFTCKTRLLPHHDVSLDSI
jgi:hypothetical protein